ncbi:hypothetical protein O0V09_18740 [Dasania sp. GY-19]|uniref:Uncharacterized protein n=1 Tax=Dasania phycosphaerae TaxID=2950436 RepID=A0A9J6RSR9_9GAMM|nr:hypothetical protein [Dasania phycosphaerae]MCZ0867239.1 hypothetical protein [Dasania phycosphaerae]
MKGLITPGDRKVKPIHSFLGFFTPVIAGLIFASLLALTNSCSTADLLSNLTIHTNILKYSSHPCLLSTLLVVHIFFLPFTAIYYWLVSPKNIHLINNHISSLKAFLSIIFLACLFLSLWFINPETVGLSKNKYLAIGMYQNPILFVIFFCFPVTFFSWSISGIIKRLFNNQKNITKKGIGQRLRRRPML